MRIIYFEMAKLIRAFLSTPSQLALSFFGKHPACGSAQGVVRAGGCRPPANGLSIISSSQYTRSMRSYHCNFDPSGTFTISLYNSKVELRFWG